MRTNEKGFSLLELLVVLFCLSVLLGITVPGYRRIAEYGQLRVAADQLYADLKECQSLAILFHEPIAVKFLEDNGYEVISAGGRRKTVVFPKGIRIPERKLAFNRNVLEFGAKGHPSGGGSVVLSDRHGHEIRLIVQLHTGQIQLKEGGNE